MPALSAIHGTTSTILSNLFIKLPPAQAHPDLPNQTVIVTGSNTGLGLEASRHLLRLGVNKLIMAVRSPEKGEAAKRDLLASTDRPASTVEVWALDMDSPASIQAFAARAAAELPRLDGVLANAGIMTEQFTRGGDGHERTLTVNVVGTFLLCLLLLPTMRASARKTGQPCTFTIPNSGLHYTSPLAELQSTPAHESLLERLDDQGKANMAGRYPLSKLLVLWGVRELAARVGTPSSSSSGGKAKGERKGAGPEVIINSPNPSYCMSNLGRDGRVGAAWDAADKYLARTTEEGGRTLYHGLFAGVESHGQYLTNCHVQT
jgi:NAD(P)-dependent dehydrogenase (short-subunit alcohol dehydrogenase family)